MIEISITEIALFIWGMLATAYALHVNAQISAAKRFIHLILTNEEARNDLVAQTEAAMREARQ